MTKLRTPIALFMAALSMAAPATAQDAVVDLDTALRCSAAFGIVAAEQQRAGPARMGYPPLAERGREFFVQTGARLMDERKLTREQVQSQLQEEVARLQADSATDGGAGFRKSVMPSCLALLDATLPVRLPPPR